MLVVDGVPLPTREGRGQIMNLKDQLASGSKEHVRGFDRAAQIREMRHGIGRGDQIHLATLRVRLGQVERERQVDELVVSRPPFPGNVTRVDADPAPRPRQAREEHPVVCTDLDGANVTWAETVDEECGVRLEMTHEARDARTTVPILGEQDLIRNVLEHLDESAPAALNPGQRIQLGGNGLRSRATEPDSYTH